jgi:hypothetical protein
LRPARRYSWPPFGEGNDVGKQFEQGNQAAVTHGAFSPRKLDPLIAEITAWVQSLAADARPDSPIAHLRREERLPAILAWARAEARVLRFDAYVAAHGELDEQGNETAACQALGRWEDRAEKRRIRIGLDAQSEAQLREAYREQTASDAHAELLQLYGPQPDED